MAKYKTFGRPEAVWNKLGGEEGVDRFLRDETMVMEKPRRIPCFYILSVDRSVRPTYPDGVEKVMHPDLEATGPEQCDPGAAILYSHPKQKNGGWIKGNELYAFLKETGLIEHCWSLRDGEELKENPHLYPEAWKGKCIFLWKSVVLEHRSGALSVPYVYWNDGAVDLGWGWLVDDLCDAHPAALSAS